MTNEIIARRLSKSGFLEYAKAAEPLDFFGQLNKEVKCLRSESQGKVDGHKSLFAAIFNPTNKGGWYQTPDGVWRNRNWNYAK